MRIQNIQQYNINTVNDRYSSKKACPSFEAGIGSKLTSKLMKNGVGLKDIMEVSDEVSSIIDSHLAVVDAVYVAKNKMAEFFVSSAKQSYIESLDMVNPGVATAKGENLFDALKNLTRKDLVKANNEYILNYKSVYEATKAERAAKQAQIEAFNAELKKRFEEDNSFWPSYYRSIEQSKRV